MPKIPRSEPMMRVALADQPTMNPDMITGPGRALQQLGHAIGGLSGVFEASQEPSDTEKYDANLALVKFSNDTDAAEAERQANFAGDPTGYSAGSLETFDTRSNDLLGSISQNPKIQQGARLHLERMRGGLYDKSFGFERTQTHGLRLNTIENTATQEIGTAKPGSLDEVQAKMRGVDRMIESAPGLSPHERDALRSKLSKGAVNQWLDGLDPADRAQAVEDFLKTPPPQEDVPQEGLPGGPSGRAIIRPQSSAPVINDIQKAKLAGVRPELVDKFSQLQGELGTTFNINSGFRDASHNAKVGGAKGSQHIHGNAIDLDVSRMSKEERINVIEKASALGFTGIGVYNNAIHLDLGGRRSWGPSYHGDSVPSWAKGAIATHLQNGFEGQSGSGGAVASMARAGSAFAGKSPDTVAAVHGVAQRIGADPSAIGAVFTVESGKDWNPKARTGSYRGVSQVGGTTLREMGVSEAQYANMSQSEQAAFYGKWLDHYKFSQKMQAAGIDFSAQPPARQAAILQAFQFAPNGDWVKRLGAGDTKTPVTNSKQARALGSTSINDMERYFTRSGVSTQVAQAKPVQVADASGNIPASAISDRLKARVDQGGETLSGGGGNNEPTDRPENTIPKTQGQDVQPASGDLTVAQAAPVVRAPTANDYFREALKAELPRLQREALAAERKAEADHARAVREEDHKAHREGLDLLYSRKLTNEWIQENADRLTNEHYGMFMRAINPRPTMTDPAVHVDLLERADENPDEVMTQAGEAYANRQISQTAFDQIYRKAQKSKSDETRQPGWVSEQRSLLKRSLRPEKGASQEDLKAYSDTLEAYDAYVDERSAHQDEQGKDGKKAAPKVLDRKELSDFTQRLITESKNRKVLDQRKTLSLPRYTQVGRDNMSYDELQNAIKRTADAYKAGKLSRSELSQEIANLKHWQNLLQSEAAAQGKTLKTTPQQPALPDYGKGLRQQSPVN